MLYRSIGGPSSSICGQFQCFIYSRLGNKTDDAANRIGVEREKWPFKLCDVRRMRNITRILLADARNFVVKTWMGATATMGVLGCGGLIFRRWF